VPMWLGPAHKLHGGRAGGQGDGDSGGAALGEEEAQCTGLDVVSIEQYIQIGLIYCLSVFIFQCTGINLGLNKIVV